MSTTHQDRLRRDLHSVASQVESLLTKLGEEGGDRLYTLKDRLGSVACGLGSAARDKLSSLDNSVRSSARHAAHFTDDYVHHNPWRAIGTGAIIGLLVGYLVSRR